MQAPLELTRRHFLRTATLAALAPAGVASAASPAHGYTDAHVHVWTSDTRRYPLAADASRKDMKPRSFTPEELFRHTRPAGVDRVVLIQMSFYGYDNRYMLDSIARYPGVFRGVAIVDESKSNVADTMKSLRRHGVRGFRIYSDVEKVRAWRHSDGMKKMWTCGADTGLAMCLLADPASLPMIREMCKSHPRTPVVIDHFARIGMKGPVRQRDLDHLCRLADFPHTHVKISAFYALGAKRAPYTDLAPMIRQLRDAYGASRLMWGSDCPFQVEDGHYYANSLALVRDRLDFLTARDREWLLHRTANQLFFS